MKEYSKPFSYTLKISDKDRGVMNVNCTNVGKGYRKSCFSTEKAARKSLKNTIEFNEMIGRTILDWAVTENDKVIDRMN